MKTFLGLAALAVSFSSLTAIPAMAAPTITSAALTGPTGTVWNTKVDSFYTLFIARPVTTIFNPNDNFSGAPVSNPVGGEFDYMLMGDGFPTAVRTSLPSDPYYTLTLTLAEGGKTGTLSGVFTGATGLFTPTSSSLVLSSGRYALDDFTWTRTLSNLVGGFSATNTVPIGPGARADYQGAFTLSMSAVPEPATWAMMMLGFGMIGFGLRARRNKQAVRVTFA